MGLKSVLSKPYAAFVAQKIKVWSKVPEITQAKVFQSLIKSALNTQFGKDHSFEKIKSIKDFQTAVPVRDYEGIKPYIEQVVAGNSDILWPGIPIYLCKTSGTTSGTKYIPISKESIGNHIDCARNALLSYIAKSGNADFVNGKMIFLQGSPELSYQNNIPIGRLSGIVAHHVPEYLQKNRLPSMQANKIDDWEQKVDAIVSETLQQDMRLISGIPSWVQFYFEKLLERSQKPNISEIFPNFSLFVYGGVNFGPYKPIFKKLIGKNIHSIETYPASEGFIAFQNNYEEEGLLLILNKGIFYEFIPVEHYHDDEPPRLTIGEVELGKNYALIMTTNAGLWAYSIGDTVKFVSLYPHKIVVTGRISHFISAFGEHVIAEEVERSINMACEKLDLQIKEFHVAPQVNPKSKELLPYHEWFIEFENKPNELETLAHLLDVEMQKQNVYYKDLIKGKILQTLKISPVKIGGFTTMMKLRGKLGGQNKVPRLSNDRNIADVLSKFTD